MGEQRRYLRFPLSYRIEHWMAMGSFTLLAVTGLVQKFSTGWISIAIVRLLGGIESVRVIHRLAAIVLMVVVVYHIGAVAYRLLVERVRPAMLPGLRDLRNALHSIRYFLGRESRPPQQDRYTYEEKMEYWAFVWGTLVMVITGFFMWNPIATTRFLPGQVIPAAKAAHGNEAVLAVLAIILWHMYHVHIRRFNRSMMTGYMSEEEMVEEHPLELADIKAGLTVEPDPDDPSIQRRRSIFLPVYGLIAAGLLIGIYFFATFEQTAIETVPPPEGALVVYAPYTATPEPTAAPTEAAAATAAAVGSAWDGGIQALFVDRCGACHTGDGAAAGLDLSQLSGLLAGGANGPAIVPGDADDSLLVLRQSTGDHLGQFSPEELALVEAWINDGAPAR